jgi:GDP-L-fucose synthase
MDWAGRRVLVTGGRGFLGGAICALLRQRGAEAIAVGRAEADLCDRAQAEALIGGLRPEVLIHCAVQGGGIGWMKDHPVESGRDSLLMNTHAMLAAHAHGVELFIGASSACAYPREGSVPFREEQLYDGPPEPTNGPYAWSKRMMMALGQAHVQQYGWRVAFPVLANLYGPGDSLDAARAHVAAALMMRCLAGPPKLYIWGSGRPTRELLYIEDAAEGVLACADAPDGEPINIGSGQEVSIAELARAVAEAAGYGGPLAFDPSHPDGQPRKCMDVGRARSRLGWQARTPLEEGLRRTAAWYQGQLRP